MKKGTVTVKYFGELLRKYIDKSGYTIYSISYQSKINRTTLQKAISGDRPLSPENLEKILPYLKLTPYEKTDFEKAFLISHLGKETYKKHMLIKNITMNEKNWFHEPVSVTYSHNPITINQSTVIEGLHNILTVVQNLIDTCTQNCDKPFLHTVSKFDSDFFPVLYSCFHAETYEKLNVIHTIPFIKNTFSNNEYTQYNMQQLSAILPYVISAASRITFYYYYEENDISVFSSFPYSAYMTTNYNTILLSSDFQHALILPKECNAYFLASQTQIMNNSKLLFSTKLGTEIFLSATETLANVRAAHILLKQPCVFRFMDVHTPLNVLEANQLPSDQKEALIHLINLRHDHLMNLEQCFSYISYEGYQDFVEHGILYEIPKQIGRPFSIQERLLILNKILEANENGSFFTILLREKSFSPKRNVLLYDNSSLFFYHSDSQNQYHLCQIHESSVITEFCDFIDHLEKHGFSYSLTESNHIIRNSMEELEKKYNARSK